MIVVDLTPLCATVNADAYKATLRSPKEAIRHRKPGLSYRGVLPLHDNTSPHAAHTTTVLLDTWP
jgi:hypothetical protein